MKTLHITAVGGAILCAAAAAAGPPTWVTLDSFGAGNSFDPGASLTVQGPGAGGPAQGAAVFLDMSEARDGSLRAIELAFENVVPASIHDSFTVSLHAGDATQVGPMVWSRTITLGALPLTVVPIVLSGADLSPAVGWGQSSWITVMPADDQSAARWYLNDQATTGLVAVRQRVAGQWGDWVITAHAALPAVRITLQWCFADCDWSWQGAPPQFNIDDFVCYINEYAFALGLSHEQQISHYANCDGSWVAPVLNVDDFICFMNAFAQACP
jgi:hypothetical protein